MTLPAKRTVGKWERLFRERMERDRDTAKDRGIFFDAEEADRAVRFFERYCKHFEGEWAGQPLRLADWQVDPTREIFGWKREETGLRRFRTASWWTPRKNGKTTYAAGFGNKLLVQDNEPGAQVYFTATKRDQAIICHRAAGKMVKRSPELSRFIVVPKAYERGARITCPRIDAFMGPLSADHSTQDGLSPHGDIRDEVHEWKSHELAAVLDTASGARRQPITLEISTAGVYDKESVGWVHFEHACKVLEGIVEDDSLFAFITAADDDDDPFSPETWWKANPGLGVSPKLDDFERQAKKARDQPHFYNDFLRYRLNRWVQQVTRWISPETWAECPTILESDIEGRACWAGLDLSSKLDLAALVLAFPMEDGVVALLSRFYLPEETIDRESKKGRRFYEQWTREGWITATPGNVIDYAFIRLDIGALAQRFNIQEIAFDPWGATQIASELGEEDGFTMVELRQGYKSMSEPAKSFEALVVGKKARNVGGNPVLSWCVSNAAISRDAAGNIKPDKDKATDKIDGVVASIMALARADLGGGSTGSYLDDPDAEVMVIG